ncbi:hypothetical protein [Lichenicoccus sp.]|uniref:hypothetical protein n=1 Tax=Lichenicoccus sp. TaxID=2781899 RepID=UPI003D0EB965
MLAGSLVACTPALAQSDGTLPMTPQPDAVLRETDCPAPTRAVFSLETHILFAASGDTALTLFTGELIPVLSRLTVPDLQHVQARADEDHGRIDQVIRTAIDNVWPSFPVMMGAAAKDVDTPAEIAGLTQACQSLGSTAPGLDIGIKL